MSPRFEPVSVTELSRVPLLAALPGADLTLLAGRLERSELAPGTVVRRPGDVDPRFVITLSGLAAVTSPGAGRQLLRPGATFDAGEQPDGTVAAMTPCTVVCCDTATFDELIRPHLV
jgi:hypothetical protein